MFSRTKANGKGSGMAILSSGKGMPSIVSADFRVVGNVTCEGDIQLDGSVDGNVKAKSLTIGTSGAVRGEVKADKVQIQGSVTGPIRARTVEITKTAKVAGDVFYESLTVETGAVIDGACKRWDADKAEKSGSDVKPASMTTSPALARQAVTPSASAA
jgi:cytoskeletal protein CcmA (bactofilin family)